METDKMSMYSVWVDTSEKVASFHMVERDYEEKSVNNNLL